MLIILIYRGGQSLRQGGVTANSLTSKRQLWFDPFQSFPAEHCVVLYLDNTMIEEQTPISLIWKIKESLQEKNLKDSSVITYVHFILWKLHGDWRACKLILQDQSPSQNAGYDKVSKFLTICRINNHTERHCGLWHLWHLWSVLT